MTQFVDEAPGVVATPEQLQAWVATAKPGDRFVYATRAYLPAGSPGAAEARRLQEAELVYLTRKRTACGLYFNYTAQRSSVSLLDAARRQPNGQGSEGVSDTEAMNALLPVLERVARFGRPCPTDWQLAVKAGIKVEAVRPAIDALRRDDVIRVEAAPAPTLRRVVIVDRGWKTGMVA